MREIVGREALDASVRFAVFSVAYAAFIYRGQSTATLLGGYGSRGSAGSPAVTLWIGLSSGVEEAAVPRQQVYMWMQCILQWLLTKWCPSTRLETRTKESTMCASIWEVNSNAQ